MIFKPIVRMCVVCDDVLEGKQRRFCSKLCTIKYYTWNSQPYVRKIKKTSDKDGKPILIND